MCLSFWCINGRAQRSATERAVRLERKEESSADECFDSYRDIFNARCDSYHRAMAEQPLARQQEFQQLLRRANLRDGQVVCDLPSGGGYLADFIQEDVRLISVDASREFMARCTPAQGHHALLSEIHQIPLADASMDRVLSLAGLHHVEDKRPFYQELRRLLGDDGRFCIADVRAGSAVSRFLDEFVHEHSSMGHEGRYLDGASVAEIERTGLGVDEAIAVEYPWRFASVAAMSDYCRLMFGIDRADAATIRKGIEDYLGYDESPGGVTMRWELYYISGAKA